jgi:flagellar hook-associated protein 2
MAVSGITSNSDIATLVKQLMAQDQASLDTLESQKESCSTQKTDLDSISSALSSLKSTLVTLKDSSSFYSLQATSSDSDVATATASSNASITNYVLTNITLAQAAQKQGSALLLDTTYSARRSTDVINSGGNVAPNALLSSASSNIGGYASILAGNFSINGATVSINPATDTLYQVLGKINSSGAGVTATYADNRITLTSTTKGDEEIELGADTSGFLAAMKITGDSAYTAGLDDLDETLNSASNALSPLRSITEGFFNINNITFYVNPAVDTLQDIINNINDSAANVSVFYDEQSDKIMMTSKEAGKAITFDNNESNFITQVFGNTDTANFTSAGVTVNGTAFTPDGNTFTLNGVTFSLHAATSGSTAANISISRDTSTAKAAIQSFITEYNDLYNLIEEKRSSGESLANDRLLNNMRTQLRKFVVSKIDNAGEYLFLRDVGIEYKDGTLTLNSSKLTDAFNKNPDSVGKLFGFDSDGDGLRDDGGIANSMVNNFITGLTLASTGDLARKKSLATKRSERLEKNIELAQKRFDEKEARLTEQYTALVSAMAQMNLSSSTASASINSLTDLFNTISSSNTLSSTS